MSNDKNMNELRNMPKDIDILISTAKSIVLNYKQGKDLSKRIDLLDKISKSVDEEYQIILKT